MTTDVGSSELASLGTATAWINSPPLTEASLKGKVVLIDFGTYTCINWLRTLPYTRAWNEKCASMSIVGNRVRRPASFSARIWISALIDSDDCCPSSGP